MVTTILLLIVIYGRINYKRIIILCHTISTFSFIHKGMTTLFISHHFFFSLFRSTFNTALTWYSSQGFYTKKPEMHDNKKSLTTQTSYKNINIVIEMIKLTKCTLSVFYSFSLKTSTWQSTCSHTIVRLLLRNLFSNSLNIL